MDHPRTILYVILHKLIQDDFKPRNDTYKHIMDEIFKQLKIDEQSRPQEKRPQGPTKNRFKEKKKQTSYQVKIEDSTKIITPSRRYTPRPHHSSSYILRLKDLACRHCTCIFLSLVFLLCRPSSISFSPYHFQSFFSFQVNFGGKLSVIYLKGRWDQDLLFLGLIIIVLVHWTGDWLQFVLHFLRSCSLFFLI